MMDISHLSHDAAFGDPILQLDVKEQIKTREVNAREERNLQRRNEGYERSKTMCEKETAWEQRKVGQSLHEICERTPQIEKCIAMEKARIQVTERNIFYGSHGTNKGNESSPLTLPRSLDSVSLRPLHDRNKKQQVQQFKTKDAASCHKDAASCNVIGSNTNLDRAISHRPDFVRRSERSIRALAKLNWQQQNRRRDHAKLREDLFAHSQSVIEKAKVILKGRNDIDVENLNLEFENILLPPVRRTGGLDNPFKPFSRHQGSSNLSGRNVFRSVESVNSKQQPTEPIAKIHPAERKDIPKVETKLSKGSKVVTFMPFPNKSKGTHA